MRPATISILLAIGAASPALAQDPFTPGMRSLKIEADDFERSAAFYAALGMKPGTRRSETWDLVWENDARNTGILLASRDYARRAKMVRGGAYLMIMTNDVAAAADRLRKAGFPDVGQPRQMGTMVTVLLLSDPDGNRIELMGPPAK
jgi:predicted enzyme related to lactoylglutathione lyase